MSKSSAILCFFAVWGSSMSFSQDEKPILPINIARSSFTTTQKNRSTPTCLIAEKSAVSIQNTDSVGILHEQIITTQNTRIK
ncbi:hypothetical protein [Fluviicola chungangensis]|uniref:TonB-dependent receptor n=1 Tax=Fluviicola chungangensis TaxID=2597671 RepID=A0A556MPN1_9FLAO|nr:hypothetical protein [Fluviicola chungangensis]TSJ41914.1 hypothetical protein FO442_12540 [Fluviicola chungangensis]